VGNWPGAPDRAVRSLLPGKVTAAERRAVRGLSRRAGRVGGRRECDAEKFNSPAPVAGIVAAGFRNAV